MRWRSRLRNAIPTGRIEYGVVQDFPECWLPRLAEQQRTVATSGLDSSMPSVSTFPTGSWVLRPGGALFWSPEMYGICGFDPKQGPPSYLDVIARIHPADAAQVDRTVQTGFVLHKRLEGEYRLILPAGVVRHIHFWGHPVPTDVGTVEFVGIIMDVTEQRQFGTATPAQEDGAELT